MHFCFKAKTSCQGGELPSGAGVHWHQQYRKGESEPDGQAAACSSDLLRRQTRLLVLPFAPSLCPPGRCSILVQRNSLLSECLILYSVGSIYESG